MTICKHCGEDLTGKGIIAWIDHPCSSVGYYSKPTDNETRTRMIEIGMSDFAFDFFGYALPTEMERLIFKK